MENTTIIEVYTMTPRGGFKLLYKGTDEEVALKAYNKLTDKNAPRAFYKNDKRTMGGGGYPQD